MRGKAEEQPSSTASKEGWPVPDDFLVITIRVVLTRRSGSLTNRRADAVTREAIARDIVANLRRSGYLITFGPPAVDMTTPKSSSEP